MSLAVQSQVNDFGAAVTGVDLRDADEPVMHPSCTAGPPYFRAAPQTDQAP